jgi:hypothetical protein
MKSLMIGLWGVMAFFSGQVIAHEGELSHVQSQGFWQDLSFWASHMLTGYHVSGVLLMVVLGVVVFRSIQKPRQGVFWVS